MPAPAAQRAPRRGALPRARQRWRCRTACRRPARAAEGRPSGRTGDRRCANTPRPDRAVPGRPQRPPAAPEPSSRCLAWSWRRSSGQARASVAARAAPIGRPRCHQLAASRRPAGTVAPGQRDRPQEARGSPRARRRGRPVGDCPAAGLNVRPGNGSARSARRRPGTAGPNPCRGRGQGGTGWPPGHPTDHFVLGLPRMTRAVRCLAPGPERGPRAPSRRQVCYGRDARP